VKGKLDPATITAAFERTGKGKMTYSHQQHTSTESRYSCSLKLVSESLLSVLICRAEIVRWVAENMRPFKIVSDRRFQSLMKTGRPEYYIPSPSTVSQDVKLVFKNARSWMAKMLQEHEGALSFATDAWTLPNHKAFIAITVHFEVQGVPVCLILDMIEVATSHSGVNLAAAFAQVLNNFGISHKVSLAAP
jgi:hypothetical protein